MASLVMLAILAGCAVGLHLKATLAQGIVMVFNALIAGLVAFGFFEAAADFLVRYSPGMAPWAPMACFLLLAILVFAVLMAVEMQICKEKIDMGPMAERIGRPVVGVVLGYLVTGYVLVAAALAPLPSQYPYPRFDERNPNPASPNKALLSPDGFVTGLFATVSNGGFRALRTPRSFALLHAGYLDQLYLNRHNVKESPLMTSTPALDVPRKGGVWEAPDSLRDTEGKPLSAPAGTRLMLVRTDIKKGAFKGTPKFTLSQLRLVCHLRGSTDSPLAGKGQAVYPAGYIGAGGRFERKTLGEVIDLAKVQNDPVTIDLGFHVPTNLTPVLLEFKRNNVVQVSAPASAEEAPTPVSFGAAAPRGDESAAGAESAPGEPGQSAPARPRGGKGKKKARDGLSDISRSVVGDQAEEN
jgi:hypothetical protein